MHTRKIEMESWEDLMLEEMSTLDAVAGDDEMLLLLDPEPNDELYDELFFGKDDRDLHRWELDPASAEDFPEHRKVWVSGPAQRWRHFGH
jgi:hypothetical protein